MSYDRYEAVGKSVKDYKNKVEDLLIKFENLKTEWLRKGYDETSMQTVEKEVQGMLTYEYEGLRGELDALPGKAYILYPENISRSKELKSELKEAWSKLLEKYREFKKEVACIWGVGGKE